MDVDIELDLVAKARQNRPISSSAECVMEKFGLSGMVPSAGTVLLS